MQPEVEQFLTQYKRNRRFAATIDSAFRDWQINAVFYTAVHLVNAALANFNVGVTSHDDRNGHVSSNGSFAAAKYQYIDLYRICRITRYDPDPDNWIPQKYLTVNDLAQDLLIPIEQTLLPLIDKKLKMPELKLKS